MPGTRRGRPEAGLVVARSRPSSSAKKAFPPVTSRSCTSSGRDSSSPSRLLSSLKSAPRLSGPTESRSTAPSGSQRSTSTRMSLAGQGRAVARKPTGSPRSRRSAIWSTAAEDRSNHWRSSTATTTAPAAASARRLSRTASPMARGSGISRPGSAKRSATWSARRRGAVSDGSTSSTTPASRSESPRNESAASASTARAESTLARPSRARSTPICHSAVLPIPASPTSTSAEGACSDRSRKASIEASSSSRPMHSADIAPKTFCTPARLRVRPGEHPGVVEVQVHAPRQRVEGLLALGGRAPEPEISRQRPRRPASPSRRRRPPGRGAAGHPRPRRPSRCGWRRGSGACTG